ncbi:MAG TPA: LysR family transcriptional regulator [Stellaceae bacterium]|nr:LysR family transcriptional regulator [Stellaceae bacterium]
MTARQRRETAYLTVPFPGNLNFGQLRALSILLEERNLVRAAVRLNVTHQAVSQTLARFRRLFDDELLVRNSSGYVTTARAVALLPHLQKTLAALGRILQPSDSAPESFRGSIHFGVSKYSVNADFERVLPLLVGEAPRTEFRMHHVAPASLEQLESAEVDFIISPAQSESANLYRLGLHRGRWVCVTRRDHPLLRRVDLNTYLSARHLLVAPLRDGYDPVDRALTVLGKARQIALSTVTHALAAAVIAASDLVLTVPDWMVDWVARTAALAASDPLDFLPHVENSLFWHARVQHSPPHIWVRRRLAEILRAPRSAGNSN